MQSDRRIELKFICPEHAEEGFLRWLAQRRDGFSVQHPSRTISNIYFDDLNQTSYWESVSGLNIRRKYRIRWYGQGSIDRINLEVKHRISNITIKKSLAASVSIQEGMRIRELRTIVSDYAKAKKFEWSGFIFASLYNSYDRQYFVDQTGNIRLTIDRNIRSRSIDLEHNLKLSGAYVDKGIIVELKFSEPYRGHVSQILSDMPLRRSRFSKYCECLRRVS